MAKTKYYAVIKGRKPGIFTSWYQCEKQVKGFSGAIFKSYETQAEAEAALRSAEQFGDLLPSQSEPSQSASSPDRSTGDLIAVSARSNSWIEDSICVDAACSGNPGIVEYRGVCTATREVIFQKSPIPHGTNNLGEFLAIVHALAYLKEANQTTPIYSDSETAMLWVKNRKIRTTLSKNSQSAEIFDLIERALNWLETNKYSNPILKWDTKRWGEIPADFGRK